MSRLGLWGLIPDNCPLDTWGRSHLLFLCTEHGLNDPESTLVFQGPTHIWALGELGLSGPSGNLIRP